MLEGRKNSILIVLIAGIGDLVLASKSIRAIRRGYPESNIHLLTSTEASPIGRNFPFVDYVWTFPIREFRKKKINIGKIFKLILKLRKIDFLAAINLYRVTSWCGSFKMGFLFLSLKAGKKLGHDKYGFGFFLDRKASEDTYGEMHFADSMMEIARISGGIPDDRGIEAFYRSDSKERWGHLFQPKKECGRNPIIAINPGADQANKRWSPHNFAVVADCLMDSLNAKIFLLGGPGEELLVLKIKRWMKNDVVDLSGQLTLDDLVYVIDKCDLLITNDSGPMHIAAAVKTPLVALFGPETPIHTRPYTDEQLYRVLYKGNNAKKDHSKNYGLDLITPKEVLLACIDLLTEGRNRDK
ncbi:MAG: lipopolysaccharide heptosyltransferase family protein [Desulfobacteraceae bacterium]|nr:MAG: lipopolysaccharide heptosyltransferase family protein [Desulfobacteraceae bacterium]